jgi:DNA-directed RNA polymerase specialized sigma54-like protein
MQLGSTREGQTDEQKSAYIEGLKQIISDLKSRNNIDLETVAKEIVAYRSSFLGDPSRTLIL